MLKKILLLIGLALVLFVLKICIIDIFIPYQKITNNVESFLQEYSNKDMTTTVENLPESIQRCFIAQNKQTLTWSHIRFLLRHLVYDYIGYTRDITGLDRRATLIDLLYERYDNIPETYTNYFL